VKESHLPVLVASGWFPVPLPLENVRRFHESMGRPTTIVPFSFDNIRDTAAYAAAIASAANALAGRHGSRINLLGFSMGGVASLYAVKRLGIADPLATFVACSAPFRGAPLAYAGIPTGLFSRVGRQLSPGSRFLRDLHARPLPEGPRYACIAGTKDAICPASSTRFEGAERVEVPIGHNDFLANESLHALIASFFV
jgi:pimeloyl-ACP methyl ester carboxylesterase